MAEVDQFATWEKLLTIAAANKTKAAYRAAIVGNAINVFETEPHCGYYRMAKEKGGPLYPVAIWRDENGKLNVMHGSEQVALERVWPSCIWSPVSYEWYEGFTERGEPWPDNGAIIEDLPVTMAQEIASAAEVGEVENVTVTASPPQTDAEKLFAKIEAGIKQAERDYATITTQDQANAAQQLRAELTKLAGQANKKREALNRPHLDAMREINDTYNSHIKAGQGGAESIRQALRTYTNKLEADAAAEAAEAAKAAAAAPPPPQDNTPADDTPPFLGEQIGGNHPPAEQPAPPPAAAPIAFKGASGRSAKVIETKTAIITDYDKLFAHIKAFPEVKAAMLKVAQRLVDQGQDVPGVEVKQERDVA